MKSRCYGHKRNKKNAKHERNVKCMQEEFDLSRSIDGCVEEDFDRSTHVSSKQKEEKWDSMYQDGIKKELDVSRWYWGAEIMNFHASSIWNICNNKNSTPFRLKRKLNMWMRNLKFQKKKILKQKQKLLFVFFFFFNFF